MLSYLAHHFESGIAIWLRKLANNTHAHMAVEGGNLEVVVAEVARELGYSGEMQMQLRVIVEFVSGRDVFAVLPTKNSKYIFVN